MVRDHYWYSICPVSYTHLDVYKRQRVVCVIDADKNKIGSTILGAPIVGNDSKIPWAAEKYEVQEIFIAIPNLPGDRKKQILELCKNTGCKIKILPSMAQIVNDEVSVSNFREVEIEDLLGREPVKTNLDEVMGYIAGKVVLVTGGGGSIGSELCRQIAAHHPSQLVIFDIYENTTYDLQQMCIRDSISTNLGSSNINSYFVTSYSNISKFLAV